jgi:two-component system response regulator PilR (NtrC family)
VRELRNTLERASILCEGGLITPEHLRFASGARTPPPVAIAQSPALPVEKAGDARRAPGPPAASGDLETIERAMIEQALQQSRFNKSKAAKSLGLTRQQLYVRLRRYGLD